MQEPTEEQRQALRAVVDLIRLAEPLIFDLWRSHELTLAQVQCLHVLSRQDAQAGDLAKKLGMSSTSLTRILERLESRSLIERTMDLHDRRRIWVRLTDTGRSTVGSLTNWFATPLFMAIQQLDADERTLFIRVLTQFARRVRDFESAAIAPQSSSLSEEP